MLTRLFVPAQAAGASAVYFDVFNAAGSGHRIELLSVIPMVSGAVAVTGTLAVDLFLTRTTAVGTGGTVATFGGATLTAMTFSPHDWDGQNLPTGITGRLTPSGGATGGAVLAWQSVFTEETADATYNKCRDLVRLDYPDTPGIPFREGTGFRVVQGSVASAGNTGFNVLLKLIPSQQ
jgi:hypothetical protein